MPYKVLFNPNSSNSKRLYLNSLERKFAPTELSTICTDTNTFPTVSDNETLIVCGGDGTLCQALNHYPNNKLLYVPCGTLNEAAKLGTNIRTVGKCNDKLFSYVCATGTFAQIGYTTKCTNNRYLKRVLYLLQAVKQYVCHNINAEVIVDKQDMSGQYTLLVALKHYRCFGLHFNRIYKQKPQLYLIGIRSFGKDNLLNKIKLFFPLFRIFICGVSNPTINKRWFMIPFEQAKITLTQPQDFCLDGEKFTFQGTLRICQHTLLHPVTVLPDCNKPYSSKHKR